MGRMGLGGGGGYRQKREGEIADRTKSCQINFTDISSVIFSPFSHPVYSSHSPLTWTYLWGGQTDSAHALRAWVQAGILGLVQSRVHGEVLLAVHGHHHPPCKHLASSVAPDIKVGARTATRLLCSPSPDWTVNISSASRHSPLPLPPSPLLLFQSPSSHPPSLLLNLQVAESWTLCASV